MNEIAAEVVARLVFGWLRDNNFLKTAITLEEQYGMSLGESIGLNLQTRLTILEHISSLFENPTTTSNVQAKVKPQTSRASKTVANPKPAAKPKIGAAAVKVIAQSEQQNDVVITKTTTVVVPTDNKKTPASKKTEKKIDLVQIAETVHSKQEAARNQKKNVEKVEHVLTDSVDRNLSRVFHRSLEVPEWATFANANQTNPTNQNASSVGSANQTALSVGSANHIAPLSIVDVEEQVEETPLADNPPVISPDVSAVISPDVSAVALNYSSDSSSDSSDDEDGFQLKMTNGKRVPFVQKTDAARSDAGKSGATKATKQDKGKSGEEKVLETNSSITNHVTMNGTDNQCTSAAVVVENGKTRSKKSRSKVAENIAEIEESVPLIVEESVPLIVEESVPLIVEEDTTTDKSKKKKRKSESDDIPAEEVQVLDSEDSTKKKRKKKKNVVNEEKPTAEEHTIAEIESQDTQDDFRSPPKKKKKKKKEVEVSPSTNEDLLLEETKKKKKKKKVGFEE